MKNIKIPSGFRSPLRPMIYSVASALLFISLEAHAQFSPTPPYLQNESSTKGQLTVNITSCCLSMTQAVWNMSLVATEGLTLVITMVTGLEKYRA